MDSIKFSKRPEFDDVILQLTDYALDSSLAQSQLAQDTAHYCLMDSIGVAILALQYKECTKLLGPVVPGAVLSNGARVPGTNFELDPVRAAFNIGTMIRWLDYNDTWLAAEWGHPSDNLGGILATADYLSRLNDGQHKPLYMADIITAMIKAHEIQGIIALENSFNQVGLDHVLLVRVASTAVISALLGADKKTILNNLSNAWIDGAALRTYRHAPNAGSRKSWAAGDATSRAVWLALNGLKGEMGYPSALSAKIWGFEDVSFKGQPIKIARKLDSYVMENVLFKISFPAEFHAQTAVECAVKLHPVVKDKLDDIDKIIIKTQASAIRIIDKVGPLNNPADRDHSLQYMVAVGLLKGNLTADDYEDAAANNPKIDWLREKMTVIEDKRMTTEYLDPNKRSIGNALQVFFNDGSYTEEIVIDFPIGHKFRRSEGLPVLEKKFMNNLSTLFSASIVDKILETFSDKEKLKILPVADFMNLFYNEFYNN